MVKVICAGAPKTGTKSLARALRILGYNEVYDYEEGLEFGFEEWGRVWRDEDTNISEIIEKLYTKNVEAVVDLPHSHFFQEFLQRWPCAKVILMTRDEDSWFSSFKNMLEAAERDHLILQWLPYISPTSNRMTSYHKALFRTILGSERPNPLKWKMWFRRHNAFVKSVVPAEQLLIFNVKEGWDPLCQFLDKKKPDQSFPVENVAGSKTSIVERVIEDTWLVKRIKLEATIIFCTVPVLLAALLYYLIF